MIPRAEGARGIPRVLVDFAVVVDLDGLLVVPLVLVVFVRCRSGRRNQGALVSPASDWKR